MTFEETPLAGAYVLGLERHDDERGFFARTFAADELEAHGLSAAVVQGSIAWNRSRGTIRGMHFQLPPHAEVKIVRCVRGSIHDVIVDLRPESATYGRSFAIELDDERREALYVPERFAHGYQVLSAEAEVSYLMSAAHAPEAATGLRYDDPGLGLEWPLPPGVVSERDLAWPPLAEVVAELRARLRAAGSAAPAG
jgi:dTDP-4-dehydrorhamnose 3,5-epimerase